MNWEISACHLLHSFSDCCTIEWRVLFAHCSNQFGHIVSHSLLMGHTLPALYCAQVRVLYVHVLAIHMQRLHSDAAPAAWRASLVSAELALLLIWSLRPFKYESRSSVCETKVWTETSALLLHWQLVTTPAQCCSWPLTSLWREVS